MRSTKLAAAFFFLGVNIAAAQQVIDLATPTPTPKAAPLASVAPTVAAPTPSASAPTAAPEIVVPAATTPPTVAARQTTSTPAHSKATAPAVAAAAPRPTPPPAPKEYSGRIRVTFCNDATALGLDLATNMTVIVEPRFQGAHPGMVADLIGNRVIRQTRTTVTVACRSGAEDRSPYHNPNGATETTAKAVGTALGVLKTLGGH